MNSAQQTYDGPQPWLSITTLNSRQKQGIYDIVQTINNCFFLDLERDLTWYTGFRRHSRSACSTKNLLNIFSMAQQSMSMVQT